MNALRNRGVGDLLIAVADGPKGFPEAVNAAFPGTIVQAGIVHLLRNSMSFACRKDRKPIAQAPRSVCRAETAEAGLAVPDTFEPGPWGKQQPAIAQSWGRHGDQVIPFLAFPERRAPDHLHHACGSRRWRSGAGPFGRGIESPVTTPP